jgi:hypothetical protein
MTDHFEGLVREALTQEAERTQPVPDLAARARGRLRRRRQVRARLAATVAVLVVSTVVIGVASRQHTPPPQPTVTGPAGAVTSTIQLKPLVAAAHLTASVQLGDGALRLDPPTGTPGLRESDAVRLWAAAVAGAQVFTGDTVVFLADATVRVPVAPPEVPHTLSTWATPGLPTAPCGRSPPATTSRSSAPTSERPRPRHRSPAPSLRSHPSR